MRKLKEQYPKEGPQELARRLHALCKNDETLLLEITMSVITAWDAEDYDKAAREARKIPEALKKPS